MSRQASHAAQAADLSLTERRNPRTADIDLATAVEIVDLMVAEDAQVPAAVATQRDAIARAIDIAVTTFRPGLLPRREIVTTRYYVSAPAVAYAPAPVYVAPRVAAYYSPVYLYP